MGAAGPLCPTRLLNVLREGRFITMSRDPCEYLEYLPHTIYRYTDSIYKVVQFKRSRPVVVRDPGTFQHSEVKLDPSLSRARKVVLEVALCNSWDWFFTCTISGSNYDRTDLAGWRDSLTQWLRDQRKKFGHLAYLLVPEKHEDGSWHAHGFLRGVPRSELIPFICMDASGYRGPEGHRLPDKLLRPGFMNWSAYLSKFGFCSLMPIKNPVSAAFYMSKYITKDNSRMVSDVGLHLYYCSQGLKRSDKYTEFTGRYSKIEDVLTQDYEFCRTGFTRVEDGFDWAYWLHVLDDDTGISPLFPPDPELVEAYEQLKFLEMG